MNSKQLKILAVCCMVFDHVTRIFPLRELFLPVCEALWAAEQTALGDWVLERLPYLLSYIGRLAAPLFLFGAAESFAHTRSTGRYLRRLLMAAILSQVPYVLFDLAESRLFGLSGSWRDVYGNILFTIALGVAALWLCERLRGAGRPFPAAAGALAAMGLSYVLPIEGGKGYVLLIFVFYYTRRLPRWQRGLLYLPAVVLARLGLVLWAFGDPRALSTVLLNILGPYLGMLAALLYNGRKGRRGKAFERFWYAFYPAHFALLALAGFLRPPF